MNDRSLPVWAILAAGIGMGVMGDQLLRTPGGPGLNVFVLFAALGASVWIVSRSGPSALGPEALSWIGVGVVCSAALLWRGSGLLRFGTFLAACTAFSFPALEAGRAWVRKAGILDVGEALAGAGLHTAFGSARLLIRESWNDVGAESSRGVVATVARKALGGTLLAVIPLGVFGALFLSADQVFATLVGDFVTMDLQLFGSHLLGSAVLSWLACGYLVGVSSGTRLEGIQRLRSLRPSLGVTEVAMALGLVDLLFLAFVIVQFRYLFGGGVWVEITPGLTYAAYARAGFFQLVAAVALSVPWLLLTHALLHEHGFRARATFAALGGVQLLLLVAIVASAMQRMLTYQDAYGLTELRIVVTAVLAWLTVVLVWFGATVLSGRRHRFVPGAVVTAFFLVGALQLINPAGWAARHNLDRIEEPGGVDVEYLGALGSDAAPLLADRLGELAEGDQCVVANRLLGRWGPERPADWKSYNWSESRARHAVQENLGTLRRLSVSEGCG